MSIYKNKAWGKNPFDFQESFGKFSRSGRRRFRTNRTPLGNPNNEKHSSESNVFSGVSARYHQTQLQPRNALKPRAPNNTTSFLMSDLEKRQHEEDGHHQQQPRHVDNALGEFAGEKEVGLLGATDGGGLTTPMMADGGALLADGTDIEEQRDADFEECLFSTSIERIERLSRDEVNRELLLADRDNRMLKQRVALLRDSYLQTQEENRKLKRLLKDNGINSL